MEKQNGPRTDVAAVAVVMLFVVEAVGMVLGVVVTADVTDLEHIPNISSSIYRNQFHYFRTTRGTVEHKSDVYASISSCGASVEGSKALTQSHRHDTRPISIGKVWLRDSMMTGYSCLSS